MDTDRPKSWPARALSVVSVALPILAFALLLLQRWQEGAQRPASADYASLSLQASLIRLLPGLLFALALLGILMLVLSASRLRRHNARLEDKLSTLDDQLERLRRSETNARKRYHQVLDNAGDAIFFIHPDDGTLVEANRQAEDLLGYSAEEVRRLSLSILFPGTHQRRYQRLVKRVMKHGYGEESNLTFRRRDGSLFTGAVHARLGDLGEEKLVHGVLRDVTDRKRIEKELRQKNQDLLLVNKIAHRAAATRNLDDMLTVILEEVIQTLGAEGGGIYLLRNEGADLELRVHRGVEEEVLAELRKLTPGEGLAGRVAVSGHPRSSVDVQKDCRLSSQAVRNAGWHGFQAVPLTAKEKTVGILFIFNRSRRVFSRDQVQLMLTIGRQLGAAVEGAELLEALRWQYRLTEASSRELERSRQQLRENLARVEESNRTLERIDRMKSNFLALASHELRTPLTCVLSGAEMLDNQLQGRLGAGEHQILNIIFQGGKRLESIVEDLLEVAKIESQSIYLARESVHIPTLLQDIGSTYQPIMRERNLSYRLAEVPSTLSICGDSHHLKKAFGRLLENAVKFTPEGGRVEISGALVPPEEILSRESVLRKFSPAFFHQPPRKPMVQISVRDNGVGIDPEEHIRVFDKFYEIGDITQHFTSQTRFGGKGVGLGLTLVKGMVEAHGGMVWVESAGTLAAGSGSAFNVLLPVDETNREPRLKNGHDA